MYEIKSNHEQKNFIIRRTKYLNDINMSPTTESFEFTDFNPLKSIPLYKVVLLGNVGVGKSTFFRRYRDGYFTHVKNDCGLDKFERVYKRKNKNVKVCTFSSNLSAKIPFIVKTYVVKNVLLLPLFYLIFVTFFLLYIYSIYLFS